MKPHVYLHAWMGKDEETAARACEIYAEVTAAMDASGLMRNAIFRPIRSSDGSEMPTLCWLHYDAGAMDPRTPILYLHLKGASWLPGKRETACIDDWRRLMTYFCVTRWPDALEKLTKHGAVGCNVSTALGRPHFSGNFWWSTAGALKSLPRPQHEWPRIEAEFWIGGLGTAELGSLHQSGVDHYFVRYPREVYEGVGV